MAYTPGPWKILDLNRKPYAIGPDRTDPTSDFKNPLGVVFRSHVKGKDTEQIDNAYLIAASPDMFEALERVGCQYFACPGPDKPIEDMATCYVCAAIRKAKGKEN
jgi:hypothetical protein